MVFATAVRLLGNAADAEDAAQTVFLRAYERFDTVGPSPTAPGWLKKVTTNLCLDHLSRYRKRWRLFSEMGRDGETGGSAFEDRVPAPVAGDGSVGHEERATLEQALYRLPDSQRVPLVLFHFEGQAYQEIADVLGVSLGKVKTDIHRGREALRQQLVTRDDT